MVGEGDVRAHGGASGWAGRQAGGRAGGRARGEGASEGVYAQKRRGPPPRLAARVLVRAVLSLQFKLERVRDSLVVSLRLHLRARGTDRLRAQQRRHPRNVARLRECRGEGCTGEGFVQT